jgi:hypothetical protein
MSSASVIIAFVPRTSSGAALGAASFAASFRLGPACTGAAPRTLLLFAARSRFFSSLRFSASLTSSFSRAKSLGFSGMLNVFFFCPGSLSRCASFAFHQR